MSGLERYLLKDYRGAIQDYSKAIEIKPNFAYIIVQIPCELVKVWKRVIPKTFWMLPVVGFLIYWLFRLLYIGKTERLVWALERFNINFPKLNNHFFVLKKGN